MGQLTEEVKKAEQDYQQSLTDQTNLANQIYEENRDFNKFAEQADQLARQKQKNEQDLQAATGNRLNYQPRKLVDIDEVYNKKKTTDTLKQGYLQLASEEAKMKYNLAAQKKAQAQANWINAGKILQGLGCVLSLIPGIGWALGGATAAIGAGVSAIGSANV